MKALRIIDDAVTKLVEVALVTLFGVMAGLTIVQVFLRYFFNSSLLWADVAARSLVLWVGFLGGVLATSQNKHFHIDVITRFLSPRVRFWLQNCSNLFASLICFYLGQAGMTFLGLDAGAKTFLDLPVEAVEVIVPAGFYMMTVLFVLRTIRNFADGVQPPAPDQPERVM